MAGADRHICPFYALATACTMGCFKRHRYLDWQMSYLFPELATTSKTNPANKQISNWCEHVFHPKCLNKHFRKMNTTTCPLCRGLDPAALGEEEEDDNGMVWRTRPPMRRLGTSSSCCMAPASTSRRLRTASHCFTHPSRLCLRSTKKRRQLRRIVPTHCLRSCPSPSYRNLPLCSLTSVVAANWAGAYKYPKGTTEQANGEVKNGWIELPLFSGSRLGCHS